MASLKKPKSCECGSTEINHEYHPERWVCAKCGKVLAARGSKPHTGICRVCGAKKSDGVPFKPGKNLCMAHYREYMDRWYKENHEAHSKQKREYYRKNRKKLRKRANAYYQSTAEIFINGLVRGARTCSKQRLSGKKRATPLEFDIVTKQVIALYNAQNGLCAISRLPLKHEWGKLGSMSIDRIDSSVGYVINNIQLVCKGINMLKNRHSQEDVRAFLDEITNVRTHSQAN